MKVLLINGSQHKEGNTKILLEKMATIYKKHNIETEIFYLGNNNLAGCFNCGLCFKKKDQKCHRKEGQDLINKGIQKIIESDGVVFGTPVHFGGMSSSLKSFLDRAFYVSTANGSLFSHRAAASIASVRRGGGTSTLDQVNKFIAYDSLIQIHGNYWPATHGALKGEVEKDIEGIQTVEIIAENMSYVIKALNASKDMVEKPDIPNKKWMNFVR